MKALVWHGPRDVRIDNVPDPSIVNPHDALVKVSTTAICGSDLHLYNGSVPAMRPGDILGHEFMGEIVATGTACEHVKIGDRVIVMCGISCGRCWFCKHELYAACDNTNPAGSRVALEVAYGHAGGAVFGYSQLYGGYAGGQAEYVRVPFADVGCVKVPRDLTDEQVILLTDIFPTGFMAAENCRIQLGDTIAVFGAGPVGQLAIASALMLGAEHVIAIDDVPERLAMAAQQGAIIVDENHGGVLGRIDALTGGRGPDAVIDAVGMADRASALRTAIMVCRKGGIVSIPGVHGGFADKFPIGAAFAKGLTLVMGQTHFHRYAKPLLDRVRAGVVDPSFVITDRARFDDLPAMYARSARKLDGCVKVIARL